jgi:hypothetical protein
MHIDFGSIYERRTDLGYEYRFGPPTLEYSFLKAPLIISNHEDIETFQSYAQAYLISKQEQTFEDTKNRLIAVFTTMIAVFRLPENRGAKDWIKLHLTRTKVLRNVDGNDNLCMFEALSYLTLPPKDNPTLKDHSRCAEAKRLFKNFYGHAEWRSYPGFNIAGELERFMHHFKVNVTIYEWNGERYYLEESFCVDPSFCDFDILVVHQNNEFHDLNIRDTSLLTGLRICSLQKLRYFNQNQRISQTIYQAQRGM